MAATATATEAVAAEIVGRLQLRDPVMIRSGFDPPQPVVRRRRLRGARARRTASAPCCSGALSDASLRPAIVYCGTRKDCEEVAELLRGDGVRAEHYHAGLPTDRRSAVQAGFMRGDLEVIVATNAFGMGRRQGTCGSSATGRSRRASRPTTRRLAAVAVMAHPLARCCSPRAPTSPGSSTSTSSAPSSRRPSPPTIVASRPAPTSARSSRWRRPTMMPAASPWRSSSAPAVRASHRSAADASHVTVTDHLDDHAVRHICRESVDRGWRRLPRHRELRLRRHLRRRTLLDHFGDRTEGRRRSAAAATCATPTSSSRRPSAARQTAPRHRLLRRAGGEPVLAGSGALRGARRLAPRRRRRQTGLHGGHEPHPRGDRRSAPPPPRPELSRRSKGVGQRSSNATPTTSSRSSPPAEGPARPPRAAASASHARCAAVDPQCGRATPAVVDAASHARSTASASRWSRARPSAGGPGPAAGGRGPAPGGPAPRTSAAGVPPDVQVRRGERPPHDSVRGKHARNSANAASDATTRTRFASRHGPSYAARAAGRLDRSRRARLPELAVHRQVDRGRERDDSART